MRHTNLLGVVDTGQLFFNSHSARSSCLIAAQWGVWGRLDTRVAAITHTGTATDLSGGIGQGESTAIQQEAKIYPFELAFLVKAKVHDEYTSLPR